MGLPQSATGVASEVPADEVLAHTLPMVPRLVAAHHPVMCWYISSRYRRRGFDRVLGETSQPCLALKATVSQPCLALTATEAPTRNPLDRPLRGSRQPSHHASLRVQPRGPAPL